MNYDAILTEWINTYLERHSTNITAMAKSLDLKSRNSLQRISDGTAGRDALLKVLYAIQKHREKLCLEPEDLAVLNSIEKHIVEGENYGKTYSFLGGLFFPEPAVPVRTRILGSPEELSLNAINPSRLRIEKCLVINAVFPSAISLVEEILAADHSDCEAQAFSVRHYVIRGDDPKSYMKNITTVFPLILNPSYEVFFNREGCMVPIDGNSNSILLCFENGEQILILFESENVCLTVRDKGIYEKYSNLLEESQKDFLRLNTPTAENDDFLKVYEIAAEEESSADTWMISPDLSFSLIMPDIIRDAFTRSAEKNRSVYPDDFPRTVAAAHEIRRRKYLDGTHTRKIIASKKGFERFFRTGHMTECGTMVEPLTVTERLRILANLYVQMREKSYFNLYLTDETGFIADSSIGFIIYGMRKLRIVPAMYSGDVMTFHNTVEICDPECIDAFLDFYENDLITHHTLSAAQTADVIKELIASLAAEMDREITGENR